MKTNKILLVILIVSVVATAIVKTCESIFGADMVFITAACLLPVMFAIVVAQNKRKTR